MKYKNLDFLYRNRIWLAISTLFRYLADLKKLSLEFLLVFLGFRLLILSKVTATRADIMAVKTLKTNFELFLILVNHIPIFVKCKFVTVKTGPPLLPTGTKINLISV